MKAEIEMSDKELVQILTDHFARPLLLEDGATIRNVDIRTSPHGHLMSLTIQIGPKP